MSRRQLALLRFFLLLAAATTAHAADEEQLEKWQRTVRYGIDSELSEVMEQLQESETNELNDALFERFNSTLSDGVKQQILQFFTEMRFQEAEDAARQIAEEFRQHSNELLLQAVDYLSVGLSEPSAESRAAVRDLIGSATGRIATAAVRALGRIGTQEDAEYLTELIQQRSTATDVRNESLLALGALEHEGAVEVLIDFAEDDDQSVTTRRFAIDSLGKIGDEEAIPPLRNLLSSQNSQIRVQTTAALANFEAQEITQLLVSLLRDSNATVRTEALKALAQRDPAEGIEAIRYKATDDPEGSVRSAALSALVTLNEIDTVADIATSEDQGADGRSRAIQALTEADSSVATEALLQVIEQEADANTPQLTIQLSRTLSQRSEIPTPYFTVIEQLLGHTNQTVQLYAIQAVGRAGLASEFTGALTELAEGASYPAVRSGARQTLPESSGADDDESGPNGADES